MSSTNYETCKACGYREPHMVCSDERGDYQSGGDKKFKVILDGGLYACPNCGTVKYIPNYKTDDI